jgi:hypothetical protein
MVYETDYTMTFESLKIIFGERMMTKKVAHRPTTK